MTENNALNLELLAEDAFWKYKSYSVSGGGEHLVALITRWGCFILESTGTEEVVSVSTPDPGRRGGTAGRKERSDGRRNVRPAPVVPHRHRKYIRPQSSGGDITGIENLLKPGFE